MQNTFEEKIKAYFTSKEEVIAIYLFGSYAEDKAHDQSDVDLGILLEGRDPDFFNAKRNEYLVDLGRILRRDVDPVILNTAGPELLRQIFSKGRCIVIRDAQKLARHKMVMFVQIAEFGYYRNQMQAGLIRKIMMGGSVD